MIKVKTMLVAQALISGMMAFLMTGFFSLLSLGPTAEWLRAWSQAFVTGWPVAFCLSLVVGRVAFKLAYMITGR